jgi:hypothetical protein
VQEGTALAGASDNVLQGMTYEFHPQKVGVKALGCCRIARHVSDMVQVARDY